MNVRKLKQLCYERPYVIDNVFTLNHSETQRVITKYGYPNIARVIALVENKGILTEDVHIELNWLIERHTNRTNFKNRLHNFVSGMHIHKRVAICALIVLLLAGFFGLTPAGRAIAEDIKRIIISLFDDSYSIDVKPSGDSSSKIIIHDVIEYSTIDEFESATGLTAAYIESEEFILKSATQYNHRTEIVLSTVYGTANGGTIEVQQTWYGNSAYYFGDKLPSDTWTTYRSDHNLLFHYFINSIDSSFSAVATTVDSGIYIIGNSSHLAFEFFDSLQCNPTQ